MPFAPPGLHYSKFELAETVSVPTAFVELARGPGGQIPGAELFIAGSEPALFWLQWDDRWFADPVKYTSRTAPKIEAAQDLVAVGNSQGTWLYVMSGNGSLQLLDVDPDRQRGLSVDTGVIDLSQYEIVNPRAVERFPVDANTIYILSSSSSAASTGPISRFVLADAEDGSPQLEWKQSQNLPVEAGLPGIHGLHVSEDWAFVAGTNANAVTTIPLDIGGALPDDGDDGSDRVAIYRNGDKLEMELSGLESAVVSPDGRHVYAIHPEQNALVVFAAPDESPEVYRGGSAGHEDLKQPSAVAVSPDGNRVYVACQGPDELGSVVTYTRGADGKLTSPQALSSAQYRDIRALVASPPGVSERVYAVTDTRLLTFVRYSGDSSLTQTDSDWLFAAGSDVTVSADGQFVYVTTRGTDGQLKVYRRHSVNQTTYTGHYVMIPWAGAVAAAPNDDYVYVTSVEENTLYVIRRQDDSFARTAYVHQRRGRARRP